MLFFELNKINNFEKNGQKKQIVTFIL